MQSILQAYATNAPPKQGRGVRSDRTAKRDHLAQAMADAFHDPGSLRCYRLIADSIPEAVIHRTMAEVKETAQLGRVRTRSAAIFVSAIQRYAREHNIPLGFEKRSNGRKMNRPLAAGP